MASQPIPNIVVKNQEIKDKLNDKIQANYNELALLSKHLIKSSRSNENLEKSAKIFASHENIIESSLTNLKKVGLLVSNLQFQAEAAEKSLSMLEDVQDKIKLATRTS